MALQYTHKPEVNEVNCYDPKGFNVCTVLGSSYCLSEATCKFHCAQLGKGQLCFHFYQIVFVKARLCYPLCWQWLLWGNSVIPIYISVCFAVFTSVHV